MTSLASLLLGRALVQCTCGLKPRARAGAYWSQLRTVRRRVTQILGKSNKIDEYDQKLYYIACTFKC